MKQKPVILCILDGWGYREDKNAPDNAIEQANAPNWKRFLKEYPNSLVKTYGKSVGLPDGQMGNSEVGHMNIGAGRVVMQDLPKIDDAIENDNLKNQPNLQKFIQDLKTSGGQAHLMGLVSDGGVHSHQNHILALAKILVDEKISVKIHCFLDGRDTPPDSGLGYVKMLQNDIENLENCEISTVGGRYYGMDRDNRWERVEIAYDVLANGKGIEFSSAIEGIEKSYEAKEFDEFVKPFAVAGYNGMQDGDGILMANYRSDRAREITNALLNSEFKGFERKKIVKFVGKLGMTEYSSDHNNYMDAIFPPEKIEKGLGEIVSNLGLKQLRIAETEKYAHVTFFFNGGKETQFAGEDRILVDSPKVATYDLKPEMSAYEVTDKFIEAIKSEKYDVIIANYANGDMVGHTGIMDAAVKAVETVDECLGRLESTVKEVGGVLFVTADHGNAEKMTDGNGNPYTAHTVGETYLVCVNGSDEISGLNDGALCDLSPTILDVMGIEKPLEMTGKSLLVKNG